MTYHARTSLALIVILLSSFSASCIYQIVSGSYCFAGSELHDCLFAHRPDGYTSVEPQDGWLRSEVLGHEFQLHRSRDRAGGWQYTLDVR